jgi:photosystem II stability/assembly factor-like uncharacterized protein
MRPRIHPCLSCVSASLSIVFLTVFTAATVLTDAPLGASEMQVDAERGRPVYLADDPDSPVELRSDGQGVRTARIRTDAPFHANGRVPAEPSIISGEIQVAPGWRQLGLYGGPIESMAVSPTHPNLILAGSSAGPPPGHFVYRSLDGAATWAALPIPTGAVGDVEFALDGTAFVAADQGLFRIRDVASSPTWAQIGPAGSSFLPFLKEVALNPYDPDDIWVGRSYDSPAYATVLRTRDGGATWSNAAPYNMDTCYGIAIHPGDTDVVVVCSGGWVGGGQAWRTLDGGLTWMQGLGLPNRPMRDVVHDGVRFLLCGGQDFLDQFVGVYQSGNNGQSWTQMSRLSWPSRVVRDLEIDGNIILAATTLGLFRSTDRGASWSFGVGGTSAVSLNAVRVVPGDPSRIVVGAESYGVLASHDGGAQFTPSSFGIRALNVRSVAVNPLDPQEIAAAFQGLNSGGVFTTHDGGGTWTLEPLPPTRYDELEYSADGTLYVASNGPSTVATEGVYRRNANGTWAVLGPHLGQLFETEIFDLRVSRNDPNLIVICGSNWLTDLPTIWRSTNGGLGWVQVFAGTNRPFTLERFTAIQIIEDGTDQRMLASHTSVGAVAISTDRGASWFAQQSLPSTVYGYDLSASKLDPNTIYLANSPGPCYKSHDAGATWIPFGYSHGFHVLETDLTDPNVLYGLGGPRRVSRSPDGGNTFVGFEDGIDVDGNDFAWRLGSCPALVASTSAGVYLREIDTTAPEVSVELDAIQLWPPTRELRTVHATVNVNDNCDANASFVLTSVVVEDAADASDNTTPDIVAEIGTPCVELQLRAERSGTGTGRRYLLTYTATDAAGNSRDITVVVSVPHDRSSKEIIFTGSPDARLKTELVSVQPNPFNPSTTVVFSTSRPQLVTIDIVDVRGARVDRLVSRAFPAGTHRAAWDGRDSAGEPAASGVYFVRFTSEEKVQTLKALLIK